MKSRKKRTAVFWLCIALVLCLISAVGASFVQSGFGSITVKEISWETESGVKLNALLLIPENATAETPAPAIVCSHGWYNNKEMQDLNYIEYARRGFVTMSINMYGHGDSDDVAENTWWNPEHNANGMYDAVKLLADLPYVDAGRIGVTGHSNGAQASREAVFLDNEAETQLIAACLLVSNDPIYTEENTMIGGTGKRRIYVTADDTYFNMFGSRDAGVVACKYDEFMHGAGLEDGSYSSPRDYIHQATAQSFLYFGTDPTGQPERSSYTMYTQEIDGQEAIRVIYDPEIIHPWAHFSKSVVASSVEFFDAALDAPIKLDSGNQIWQIKAVFNLVGLIGFFMFIVNFAIVMLRAPFFASLKAKDGAATMLPTPIGAGNGWFWGGLAAGAVFAFITYPALYRWCNSNRPAFFNQPATFYIAVWTLLCGLFTILVMAVSYNVYNKKHGLDLTERGVKMPLAKLGKTILLALLVVVAAYGLVFLADYFFQVDFRLWVVTIRAFEVAKLGVTAKFLLFYLVYYVALSVSVNSFNYCKIGKHEWVNTLIQCGAVALAPIVMCIIQYGYFFATGYLITEAYDFGGPIIGIWLFPIIVYIPLAALVSRKIYKATQNPYLGGLIMGTVVAVASCTNTLTYLI